MQQPPKFVEKRKQYRLPYGEKIIFSDGKQSISAYCQNISKGGMFIMSLNPLPINSMGYMAFFLPTQDTSFCVKAKVAHIVFDKMKVEIECGMGIQFQDLNDTQTSLINLHILNQKNAYQELQKLLIESHPDSSQISAVIKQLPTLVHHKDLLSLRYKVDRICTLFEALPEEADSENTPSAAFKIA